MSQTYTVKRGDTLLQIAIDHDVEFTDLLELNAKYQPNPDLIYPGDVIVLPALHELETIQPSYSVEPVSQSRPAESQGCIVSDPQCKPKEYSDILFFTGKAPTDYLCLDEKSARFLEEEIAVTDHFIETYKTILDAAPDGKSATEAQMGQHALKRQSWVEDAIYAGIIAPAKAKRRVASTAIASGQTSTQSVNQRQVNAKITELKQRLRFIENYDKAYFFDEPTVEDLRAKLRQPLDAELEQWQKVLKTAKSEPQTANPRSVDLNQFSKKTKELVTKPATRHVVEAWSVSRNRYVYLRADFVEREHAAWDNQTHHSALNQALKSGNKNDIVEAIKKDVQDSAKGTLSAKLTKSFAEWKTDGGVFNEWGAKQYWVMGNGETLFAVSEEAQLMRWGAQAAVKTTFEPTKGRIDVGVGASAAFSLAEAAVSFNLFLPYEKGYGLSLTYTDANKQQARYSFGRIRCSLKTELGAFVGVHGGTEAKAGNVKESLTTGTGILLSPKVGMDSSKGQVGLKAEGFFGAEAGGKVEGAIDWCAPENEPQLKFATLASIGTEGNLAFGAGAGADFQFTLYQGKFYFHCSARLVWGAGASGGFATAVDLDNIWEMAQVIWRGLQYVDYRVVSNINDLAYRYLIHASYLAFASDLVKDPNQALKNAVLKGEQVITDFWDQRKSRQREALFLADRLISSNSDTWSGIPKNQLLPEVVGIMLDTLVTDFAFSCDERQELAICLLLQESTYSWHKFEEILARMNRDGSKASGDAVMFDNLERINTILDGEQQGDFERWVHQLAIHQSVKVVKTQQRLPYLPRRDYAFVKKIEKIDTRLAMARVNSPDRFV